MKGTLYGVGVGPGDPELMTLKAVRMIRENEIIAVPGADVKETVAYKIAMYTEALSEVSEKKLHPTCPKEQGSGESEAGLACVALHEHTSYGDYESYEAHQERRIVKRCRLEEVLHENHKSVP